MFRTLYFENLWIFWRRIGSILITLTMENDTSLPQEWKFLLISNLSYFHGFPYCSLSGLRGLASVLHSEIPPRAHLSNLEPQPTTVPQPPSTFPSRAHIETVSRTWCGDTTYLVPGPLRTESQLNEKSSCQVLQVTTYTYVCQETGLDGEASQAPSCSGRLVLQRNWTELSLSAWSELRQESFWKPELTSNNAI